MTPSLPGDSAVDAAALVVGLLSLALAVAVAFGGPLTAPLVAALSPVFGPVFLVVAGLLTGVLAAYSTLVRSGGGTAETPTVHLPAPPAGDTDDGASTVGGRLDTLIAEVHADDADDTVGRVDATVNRQRVRDRLGRLATEVLRDTEGYGPETAADRLESGAWTDRPRARRLLGRDVPRLPLSVRLRDWASGEGFRRRAAATAEELATFAGVETPDDLAPPPVAGATDPTDRSPVDWPPEPTTDARAAADADADRDAADSGAVDDLDDLLDGPPPAATPPTATPADEVGANTGPTATASASSRFDGRDGPDVFRRTVVPSDEGVAVETDPAGARTGGERE